MLLMHVLAALVLGVALGGLGLIALADRASEPALPFGPACDLDPAMDGPGRDAP